MRKLATSILRLRPCAVVNLDSRKLIKEEIENLENLLKEMDS